MVKEGSYSRLGVVWVQTADDCVYFYICVCVYVCVCTCVRVQAAKAINDLSQAAKLMPMEGDILYQRGCIFYRSQDYRWLLSWCTATPCDGRRGSSWRGFDAHWCEPLAVSAVFAGARWLTSLRRFRWKRHTLMRGT